MSAVAPEFLERTLAQSDLLSHIGNTPLLEIRSARRGAVSVFAKAEFLNPGGSVKDRPALNMILQGEKTGQLDTSKTLLDSTSGNTGIAYAMICAAKGYRAKLCLPANASPERIQTLKAFGAELVLTDPAEGSDGALRVCQQIYNDGPAHYFYPDQYSNPANWQAHYETTGPEIIQQTAGKVTHFLAAIGTSGTFVGVSRRFRRDLPHVQSISVQPASPLHGLEGTRHLPSAIVPSIYDPTLAADNIWIETEDAYAMARQLAREEGLLVGISAAANVLAATRLAERLSKESRDTKREPAMLVTVLCDGGQKYLSEPFWND